MQYFPKLTPKPFSELIIWCQHSKKDTLRKILSEVKDPRLFTCIFCAQSPYFLTCFRRDMMPLPMVNLFVILLSMCRNSRISCTLLPHSPIQLFTWWEIECYLHTQSIHCAVSFLNHL